MLLQGFGFFVCEGRMTAFLIEEPKWRMFGDNGTATEPSQRGDTRQVLRESRVRMIKEELRDGVVKQNVAAL